MGIIQMFRSSMLVSHLFRWFIKWTVRQYSQHELSSNTEISLGIDYITVTLVELGAIEDSYFELNEGFIPLTGSTFQ